MKKIIIEFSEHWLKAVVLNTGAPKHNQIQRVVLEPLEANLANVSDALLKVFPAQEKKIRAEVTVVLSRNKITLRRLDLPSRERHEIEQMLSLHVIRQVPYPKEEIIWGYQNLGFDGISNSNILLAVMHRDVPRNIFNLLLTRNILPDKMLMSSQGVLHYLQDALKGKLPFAQPYLILDIDDNFSDLMLVNNQQLNSSVVISQGAERLQNQDEQAKFCAELKQALMALRSELPGAKPQGIFLTHGAGSISGLDVYLEKETGLRAQEVKSGELENLGLSSANVSLAAVLGFAYQQKREDISFTLAELEVKKEVKLKIKQLLTLGICLGYIFILAGVMAMVRLNQLQSYRDNLDARIVKLKRETGDLVTFNQKIILARQYLDAKDSSLIYLYEFSRICPDNIALTNFNWERQKNFVIRGYGLQMSDIFNFGSILENSQLFKGMKTRYTRRRKAKDKEVIDFEISLK